MIAPVVHSTELKKSIERFMQTRNTDFIYRNDLDKTCFQHDMVYGKSKDIANGTQSDRLLIDKPFKIASDPKYDGYQRGLASMAHKFFDEKPSVLLHSQIINSRMNFIKRLLENLRNEKFIHLLETIFRVNIVNI